METVGSNYRVIARKALYEAKKPFTFMSETASRPSWYACVNDARLDHPWRQGTWLTRLDVETGPR